MDGMILPPRSTAGPTPYRLNCRPSQEAATRGGGGHTVLADYIHALQGRG